MSSGNKISIIVPIYNADRYLYDCIESLIVQQDDNLEIILVNDGSTDESGAICKVFQEKDDRIKYVQIENSGVSVARNIGMEKATGDWIGFVDADDCLCENAIEDMRSIMDETADAIYCNYIRRDEHPIYSGKVSVVNASEMIEATLDYTAGKYRMSQYFFVHPLLFAACWGKLFRRSIIEQYKICFSPKLRLSEDLCFNIHYLMHCNRIVTIDKALYQYNVNMQSVTHTCSLAHLENRSQLIEILNSWNMGNPFYEKVKNKYIMRCVLQINEKIGITEDKKAAVGLYGNIISREYVKKILYEMKQEKLSDGQFQNVYYKVTAALLRHGCVRIALVIGQIYLYIKK